jgi:hypothetical protein
MKQLLTAEQVTDLLQISETTPPKYLTEGPSRRLLGVFLGTTPNKSTLGCNGVELLIPQRKRQEARWRPRLSLPLICRLTLSDQAAKPY